MTDERRPAPPEQAADHDQPSPGRQADMRLRPDSGLSSYKPAGKLAGKAALVTGGDSGIGRAVAIAYAMEGADVAIAFDKSDDNAAETARIVESEGRRRLKLKGDVSSKAECDRLVREAVGAFGRLDVLVNNAAVFEGGPIGEIAEEVLERSFRVNVSTKSLAPELAERGVRVNAVVPGPFWTPAVATSGEETVKGSGTSAMMGRAGQPEEIAPAYVFLAADAPLSTGSFVEATGGFKATDS